MTEDKKSSLEEYGILNFSPAMPTVPEEILNISGKQVPYFRAKQFSKIMKENEQLTLKLSGCEGGKVIFLTASGTGAMDATVSNLVSNEDKVLVINGGAFGQRWKDICDFYKINSYNFNVEFGKDILYPRLEQTILEFKPTILLTQHVETSSGQKYDMNKLGKICRENKILFIVDAIGSFANDDYKMDKWNIDVSLFSSHKGLSLFSGTSAVILNKKTLEKQFAKRSFYFDFTKYLKFELGNDMAMPFTPNVSSMIQLNHRLKQIEKIGMDNKIKEVKEQAEHFREITKDLPLKIVAENPSNCLTAFYTEKNDVKDFFEKMVEKRIYFSPTGGERGKFIVTHMGEINKKDNFDFLEELKKWLLKE